MAEYDFSTLNSSDLEELVCDFLNMEEKSKNSPIKYKTYKDGKDKGIDLLYSTAYNDYEIIGQVKHYYRSGYKSLIQKLKKEELEKVKNLNPRKYILATSVDLTAQNELEIKGLFHPFIRNQQDVIGKKDINKGIEQYPELLSRHYKLWYSSTNILKKLLNFNLEGRSNEFQENVLKRKLRLHVEIPALAELRKKLQENNFIILTGDPGVGKTTTAEILLYEYIKDGYELVYIYDDIKEIEDAIKKEDTRKQIFYFDDFLGHNSVEISKAKGSETALLKILRRISNSTNKKLILTTRIFLLKTAIEESEKLRIFNLKARESTITLHEYDKELKLKLLKNHIEESEIPSNMKVIFQKEKLINFIINHTNFSPRSVEFILSPHNVVNFTTDKYENYIYSNFNKPDQIWRHAYEQQINELDRLLLNTMISFGDSVEFSQLENAFNERLNYEVLHNNFIKPLAAFKNTFNRLEGGFIVLENVDDKIYKFVNPSLVDFLIEYLQNDKDEVIRICESATYLQQLTARIFILEDIVIKHSLPIRLSKRIIEEHNYFIKSETANSDRLSLSILIQKYLDSNEADNLASNLLTQINDWSFLIENRTLSRQTIDFLNNLENKFLINTIKDIGNKIFVPLSAYYDDLYESVEFFDHISKEFSVNLVDALKNESDYNFEEHFSNLIIDKIDEEINDLHGYSNAQDFVDEKKERLINIRDSLRMLGLNIEVDFSEFSAYDWWGIGTSNYIDEQIRKDD